MNHIMDYLKKHCQRLLIFFKWVAIALVVGCIVGSIGCVFYLLLMAVGDFRVAHPMVIWLLPIGGILIVFLYRIFGVHESQGTNLVLLAVRSEEDVPLKMSPLIFIGTIITHFVGGSAGREGAALQLGGSLAQQLGRWFKLDAKDMHIITMCGMSACFSAVFGTPIASAVFSLEVVSVGVMYYAALVPCALASIISVLISNALGVTHEAFNVAGNPTVSALPLMKVLVFGALCALVSFLFCKLLSQTEQLAKQTIKNQYLRTIVGSVLILVLTLMLNTRDYLGAGMPIIQDALSGNVKPFAFVLKMLFTAITLAAAFKGGEIVPCFFVGATFGAVIGPLLGLDASFCAALGMIAVFCGVTNCPVTSIIMGFELFGMPIAPYLLIVCATSYMLSGYTGLYSKQKILYSKFRSEFIDRNTLH